MGLGTIMRLSFPWTFEWGHCVFFRYDNFWLYELRTTRSGVLCLFVNWLDQNQKSNGCVMSVHLKFPASSGDGRIDTTAPTSSTMSIGNLLVLSDTRSTVEMECMSSGFMDVQYGENSTSSCAHHHLHPSSIRRPRFTELDQNSTRIESVVYSNDDLSSPSFSKFTQNSARQTSQYSMAGGKSKYNHRVLPTFEPAHLRHEHNTQRLLHRHGLGEISWEIHVKTLAYCEPICNKLQRYHIE